MWSPHRGQRKGRLTPPSGSGQGCPPSSRAVCCIPRRRERPASAPHGKLGKLSRRFLRGTAPSPPGDAPTRRGAPAARPRRLRSLGAAPLASAAARALPERSGAGPRLGAGLGRPQGRRTHPTCCWWRQRGGVFSRAVNQPAGRGGRGEDAERGAAGTRGCGAGSGGDAEGRGCPAGGAAGGRGWVSAAHGGTISGPEPLPSPERPPSGPACREHLAGGVRGALRGPVNTAKQ